MEIREIRLERLLALLTEERGKRASLAARLKKSPSQLSQWLGRYRTISEDSAREIERNSGKPVGWLDQHAAQADEPPAHRPPDLTTALERLGIELARDLPADVRQDVADALHKLAMRRGAERDQLQVRALLAAPQTKRQSA
jgi:transcriptional regulator with XRE-family HTH domain